MPSAIVRLLCESRSASRTVRDAATDQRPFYWRGSSVKFQLALSDGGAFLLEPAVGEIIVEVKVLTALATDDCLMRKTFVAGDCDETFSAGNWGGGSKQLLEASFTVNEAAILPGIYRLIVRHIDGDGEENIYLSSELQVIDPQSGSEGIDPPPVAWSYLDSIPSIRYTPQALTTPQKTQARANLGIDTLSMFGVYQVVNMAQRLATSDDLARNRIVIQLDTDEAWVLVIGGDPAEPGDWILAGDRALASLQNRLDSGVRLFLNGVNGWELGLWNTTLNAYRVIRLTGAGANEKITFDNPP